jgi:RNA polymerase sigma factor (sigma-70 family)
MTVTDGELIHRYCVGSQDAFRELVRRHLNLVFSAARRQMRSSALAEEVTQSVFIKLARDAGRIDSRTPLPAWLHTVTRHTAINTARTESRRQKREQISVEISTMSSSTSDWSHVEPLLDEAVADLPATDRCAIILRFFDDKTLREVGETLGLSEEAARKRVSRALEQLRSLLLKRGVAVSSSALAADLTTHAIQVAPVGLSVAVLSGVAMPAAGVAHAVVSTLAMTTMQKSLLVAIGVIAVGVGLYQARTISRQSSEIALLRENNAALGQRQDAALLGMLFEISQRPAGSK